MVGRGTTAQVDRLLRFRRASESYLIGILKVFVCKRFALLGCPLHRSAKTPVFANFYQRVLAILWQLWQMRRPSVVSTEVSQKSRWPRATRFLSDLSALSDNANATRFLIFTRWLRTWKVGHVELENSMTWIACAWHQLRAPIALVARSFLSFSWPIDRRKQRSPDRSVKRSESRL